MNYTNIKPCPFCGGIGVLKRKSKTMVGGELKHCAYIFCTKCDARGSRFLIEEFENPNTARKMAIINWNKRYTFKEEEEE